jgi:SAM-dependent methyltransferase
VTTADEQARTAQRAFYDARYKRGYMSDFSDFYEALRVRTVKAVLERFQPPAFALDYGCGEGRYLELLAQLYPQTALFGSDVSTVGLGIAKERNPKATLIAMSDERVQLPDASVDLIMSIEVIEHVADVRLAVAEFGRLLAPGGTLLVTTPCANRWSAEWIQNRLQGGLQRSADGFGRFATDEPAHLRRLTSRELTGLLDAAGVEVMSARFRGQVFAWPLASRYAQKLLPAGARVALGMLDWRLFRRLPNGSTMLLVARKR